MHLADALDIYGTQGQDGLTGLLLEPIGWHKYARCAEPDVDPEIFYVERASGPTRPAPSVRSARCGPSA